MTTDWTDRARRYHQAIRTTLLREWDPIGVADEAAAQDEYDSYVPTIYKLLIRQSPRNAIVDYLWSVETENMGLAGNRQTTERVADRLLKIADELKSA